MMCLWPRWIKFEVDSRQRHAEITHDCCARWYLPESDSNQSRISDPISVFNKELVYEYLNGTGGSGATIAARAFQ